MKQYPIFFLILLFFFSCVSKDEDPVQLPTISIEDLSVDEGNESSNIYVRLRLSKAAEQTITAYISSSNSTAEAGSDYVAISNEAVVFQVGDQNVEYKMELKGEEENEPDEAFEVTIVDVDGATIDKGVATVSILNDDGAGGSIFIPTEGYTTPDSYPGMSLFWHDEFDGDAVNMDNWTFEIGNGSSGWGNNELEYYRKENSSIEANDFLVIEAREESFNGFNYTSSRMITKGKFDFKYGRVDIRAVLPHGQGIWPALWMLGANISSVGWPACGEIDIMELIGNAPATTHGTIHWSDASSNHASYGGDKSLSSGIFNDEFHVFSIEWDSEKIRWFLDDVQYWVADITPAHLSEFHNNHFFIFNVAVGGNWPGSPNSSTMFPQRMIVDYIRVFQ